jgi:tetratricopeptide (TPR) repeat protein
VKALLRRGQCLEDLDKPHEALKDFEKVLEIDPGLAEAKLALLVIINLRISLLIKRSKCLVFVCESRNILYFP